MPNSQKESGHLFFLTPKVSLLQVFIYIQYSMSEHAYFAFFPGTDRGIDIAEAARELESRKRRDYMAGGMVCCRASDRPRHL